MKTENPVRLEVVHSIGIITIDNPPENYLSEPEFIPAEILRDWIGKSRIKALMIRGTGRHFSAGADPDRIFRDPSRLPELEQDLNRGKELLDFLESLTIPVAAAIQGVCFGGGLEVALACHIRFCSENALFAFPETNHGLIPGLGGTIRLQERISFRKSLEMILGGDMIEAAIAKEIGLVDEIFPAGTLFDSTQALLEKMTAGRSVQVIRSVIKALQNARSLPLEEAMKEESRMFCELAREESRRRLAGNE